MQDLTHTLSENGSKVLLMLHKQVTYSSVHANNKNICFFSSIKKDLFSVLMYSVQTNLFATSYNSERNIFLAQKT